MNPLKNCSNLFSQYLFQSLMDVGKKFFWDKKFSSAFSPERERESERMPIKVWMYDGRMEILWITINKHTQMILFTLLVEAGKHREKKQNREIQHGCRIVKIPHFIVVFNLPLWINTKIAKLTKMGNGGKLLGRIFPILFLFLCHYFHPLLFSFHHENVWKASFYCWFVCRGKRATERLPKWWESVYRQKQEWGSLLIGENWKLMGNAGKY